MNATSSDVQEEWAFLGRRVLVVARFPPAEDGIGRYTDQLLKALAPGREFFRLGIPEGGGDRVRALWGMFRPLRILRDARGFDDVVVMYHPAYFHHPLHLRRGALRSRLASFASLLVVSRLCRMTFVVHEPDDSGPAWGGRFGSVAFWLEERVRRTLWASAGTLVFHSDWERRRFVGRFPPRRRTDRVVTHGSFFESPLSASQPQARDRLGLPADRAIVLLIGFLSPHKGYDRAIAAVKEAAVSGLELHIVGSPIAPTPAVLEHLAELRRMADGAPLVHFREGFVSDDDFDLWIRAADAVVVPYVRASSSGVVARAHLIGTRVITSAVGGIEEQLHPEDIRFSTDAELVAAVRRIGATRVETDCEPRTSA